MFSEDDSVKARHMQPLTGVHTPRLLPYITRVMSGAYYPDLRPYPRVSAHCLQVAVSSFKATHSSSFIIPEDPTDRSWQLWLFVTSQLTGRAVEMNGTVFSGLNL